ncbi:hypothetical protein B296_00001811 [Ensete ventricosum]|uniref:Uncharacterized protein n=1 Tax=Ensete ventricosum TaxID=4639 RepID=A0A427B416_ENSVE|nr:hypothetical protein B296_00001811 [Ensete ventricosum]
MDITTDRDGTPHRLHVPLLDEDSPRLITEGLHLRLRQELAFSELLDLAVQVRVRRHLPAPHLRPVRSAIDRSRSRRPEFDRRSGRDLPQQKRIRRIEASMGRIKVLQQGKMQATRGLITSLCSQQNLIAITLKEER